MSEREREREAETAAHQQAEAQRAQQWNKHQASQLSKVQKEQEAMRAAAPRRCVVWLEHDRILISLVCSDIGAASANRADAPAHNKFKAPEPEPSRATAKPAFGAGGGAARA